MATKRPDNRYKRSVTIGKNPNGSPKRKYVYGKTKREVDQKVAELQIEIRNGTLSEDEHAKFRDIAFRWIDECHPAISPRTKRWYTSVVRGPLAPLHDMELKKLKPMHLQAIIAQKYAEGSADKTLRNVKIIASSILDYAMDNDLVFRNVFHKVKVPKRAAAKRQPITDEQKNLIMRTWRGHRMGVPALLLLFTGMRRGELVALTWRDIDLKNRTVSVTKAAAFNGNQPEIKEPKTPAGVRTIPFPDQLVPILAEAKRSANSLYVCPDAHGGIMSDRGWLTSWNSYQHYLNIEAGGKDRSRTNPKIVATEPFTAHQLRHTYATMLYDAGVDVKTAQEFLGHADLTVTMNIYTHLSPQKRDAALQALDSHFAQSLPQVL